MTTDKELERVLNNPENVIVSEALTGLIEEEKSSTDETARLAIEGESLLCYISKVVITKNDVVFSAHVPSFSLKDLLTCRNRIKIQFSGLVYEQVPSSDISWEDKLLTLRTRRIFNETV